MAAKSGKTEKKRRGRGRPWKKGHSGNPKGRPREGESWAGIIKRIGNMTGPQLAKWLEGLQWAKAIGKLPSVTLKELVVARVFVALVNEPSPGLFGELMDRAEGTPKQTVEHSGDQNKPIKVKLVWGEESPIAEER